MGSNSAYKLMRAVEVCKSFVPGFSVKSKTKSKLHRTIGRLMKPANPAYMTSFWTTLGYTTWAPIGGTADAHAWEVVFHECRHALDAQNLTRPLFMFAYGLGATLTPFAFALGFLHWAWFPAALALLLPLPALFRAWAELRGYAVTQAIDYWQGDDVGEWYINNQLVPHFTGWSYYKMLPAESFVRWYFKRNLKRLESGEALKDPFLKAVHGFVKEYDV